MVESANKKVNRKKWCQLEKQLTPFFRLLRENKQDIHVKTPAVRGFSHFRVAFLSPVNVGVWIKYFVR